MAFSAEFSGQTTDGPPRSREGRSQQRQHVCTKSKPIHVRLDELFLRIPLSLNVVQNSRTSILANAALLPFCCPNSTRYQIIPLFAALQREQRAPVHTCAQHNLIIMTGAHTLLTTPSTPYRRSGGTLTICRNACVPARNTIIVGGGRRSRVHNSWAECADLVVMSSVKN